MKKYQLYSSDGCHLCEQAHALISELISENTLNVIDIVESEQLVARFGVHIPVFENTETQELVYWPFDKSMIAKVL
ncbi:glutaredoxin family protein [Thalassotalea agarivorans]|uniref:Glutaredoxin-like domain n=1 Tax=Thalassotalea agarivorans TaxID=349064 RepID=A0A1I0D8U3_THASX|nr:glutaredoxin family protein [Thalassotalea agarivorans]SET28067.1 Glutaredoxin-like domain [Thalassotalea agarivorans]